MTAARGSEGTGRDDQRLPCAARQSFAVVGGLAAWGVALLVAYPMVQIACAADRPVLVHLVRWAALAVAVAATAVGWSVHRGANRISTDHYDRRRVQRVGFVGLTGMLLSASGALLLIVEDLATWVIDPCL